MRITTMFQRKRVRIEIIPLIDIIFFLLATFVMVSLSMVKNQGITISLPVAATGQPLERDTIKTITVTKEGDVLLDKERMSVESVSLRLRELKKQNKDVKVLINGDHAAYFGIIVRILDDVRAIGISKVSIQTKKAEAK